MASHMSHRVPVTSRSDVEVHHLVFTRNELATVEALCGHAAETMPRDHQVHGILAACREGLREKVGG